MLVVEDDCSSGESSDHEHNQANNCKAPIPVDTDHKKISKIYNGLTSCVSDQHVHVECKEEVVGHLIGKLSISHKKSAKSRGIVGYKWRNTKCKNKYV